MYATYMKERRGGTCLKRRSLEACISSTRLMHRCAGRFCHHIALRLCKSQAENKQVSLAQALGSQIFNYMQLANQSTGLSLFGLPLQVQLLSKAALNFLTGGLESTRLGPRFSFLYVEKYSTSVGNLLRSIQSYEVLTI